MLRKLKWQIPGEPLAARYNWCQGPVPGRGPVVENTYLQYIYSIMTTFFLSQMHDRVPKS